MSHLGDPSVGMMGGEGGAVPLVSMAYLYSGGYQGHISLSVDGLNWNTAISSPFLNFGVDTPLAIAEGNGEIIVIDQTYTNRAVTTDGDNWSIQHISGSPGAFANLHWTGSEYLASGYGGMFGHSVDALNFTFSTVGGGSDKWLIGVDASGLILLCSGNNAFTSPDKINWTAKTRPYSSLRRVLGGAADCFLAAANHYIYTTANAGASWTQRYTSSGDMYDLATNGSIFVAVGANEILSSSDGITWTQRAVLSNGLFAVTWKNSLSLFVAVGANGACMTSPNGLSWTSRTLPNSYLQYGVA